MTFTLINVHISSQNSIQRTHQPFEAVSVKAHKLAICLANYIRSSGLILQKGSLAKVLAWLVVKHDLLFFLSALVRVLSGYAFALFHQVKPIAFLSCSDDKVTRLKFLLNERVREHRSFVGLHALKYFDLL